LIIDVHYHQMGPLPADENVARGFVGWLLVDFARLGISKTVDEIMPAYRDLWDDAECDKLVGRMEEAGIDVTVINAGDNIDFWQDDESVLRINEECARAAAKHPGRLIALAGIDPRRPDAPALFRRCIEEFNMKGLKWHPDIGYYPNSKEAYAVLKVADELGVPLLTHCSPLAGTRAKYAHPIHLDDIALDFPNMDIIAAHMGLMWWHEWVALAQMKKNICGDLAGWQIIAESKPLLFRRCLREILDIIGPDQVLFATDGPVMEPLVSNRRFVEIIKGLTVKGDDGIKFSDEEVAAILGNNAARIFKL
jgi:predicted TIM-barrel fold metal-dependent hydrolase